MFLSSPCYPTISNALMRAARAVILNGLGATGAL